MQIDVVNETSGAPDDEGRFRLLVDAVTDYAIYMLDPDGYVVSWNPGAERFKGYSPEDIIGQHFSRFYTPEDQASGLPARALRTALAEGRFEHEGWRVRKDGSRFWANVIIDPVRNPNGELIGFAKVTRDITERMQNEKALRHSEERFRLLVQGVTDYAIYMLDPQGHVTNWNLGAERIKGYSADEIIGKHFSCFYPEEDRAAGMPQVSLDTALRDGRFEKEGWRVRKGGTKFWANVVIDAIRDEEGKLIGFAKITRDLTERREAQLALEKTQQALFQAQKMEAIGQLTGGIAHDFNNLLTVIVGALDLLKGHERPPREMRLFESMQKAAERGRLLNQQLLAFARRQPLQLKRCNPAAIISSFETVLRRACGEAIEMACSRPERTWPVKLDVPQFEAALLNLVVNARDAMPTGGAINIAMRNVVLTEADADEYGVSAGRYVQLTVADTGGGMTPEVRARAFEPFFTTKEIGKGTGLGLSQVYGLVRQTGGHVDIQSEIDKGTTISLLLPADDDAGDFDAEDSGQPEVQPQDNVGTVLIVEDEADVLEIAEQIFEALGYQTLTATNAAAALEILREDTPVHVLFSDVVMPGGMNGVELARTAQGLRPELKILLASGYPMSALTERGLSPDVTFISKPYRWSEIDDRLRGLRRGERDR